MAYNDTEKKNKKKGQTAFQIFGSEEVAEERDPKQVEDQIPSDPTDRINPDNDFASEAMAGVRKTLEKQNNENDSSPALSADDIDADWSDPTGDETSLADNPTPDQNQIESVSKPWGTDYNENEELNIVKKDKRLEKEKEDDDLEGLNRK